MQCGVKGEGEVEIGGEFVAVAVSVSVALRGSECDRGRIRYPGAPWTADETSRTKSNLDARETSEEEECTCRQGSAGMRIRGTKRTRKSTR